MAASLYGGWVHGDSTIGRPIFRIGRTGVYNPVYYFLGMIKTWRKPGYLPLYIRSGIWIGVFGVVALIFAVTFNVLLDRYYHKNKNLHGTARFANKRDLKENGLLKREGVICGELDTAKVLANKEKNSSISMKLVKPARLVCHGGTVNTLLLAPTGSGKGVSVIIPTLLSYPHSMIIFDPKGENYSLTSGWRRTFSRVLKFAPCSYDTLRFNPVMAIRDGDEYAFRDASEIASIIFAPAKTGGNNDEASEYFSNMAKDLVTGALLHIRFGKYEDKSLAGLLHWLTDIDTEDLEGAKGDANGELGKKQCLEMIKSEHFYRITPQMYANRPQYYEDMIFEGGRRGKEFIRRDKDGKIIQNGLIGMKCPATDPDLKIKLAAQSSLSQNAKERGSTYATVRAKLALFNDPQIAYATSACDFEIEDFIHSDDPISLYLTVPYSDVTRIAQVFSQQTVFILETVLF